jgi:hypothetical protein
MAYQKPSDICPIFNASQTPGVEKELTFVVHPSITLTAQCIINMPWGRDITLIDVFFDTWLSAENSTSASCTIGLFVDSSLSQQFGSIDCGTTNISTKVGMIQISADMTTSLNFTSTDVIAVALTTVQQGPRYPVSQITVRYRTA